MSWQDELSELDRTLAEGRISADDYRRRRDELLASASSGSGPAQPQGQQGQGPFAPPFRWEATPPQQQPPANPDATQVVQGGKPVNPDATQVVSGGARPPADAERTQYVRPVTPPGGMPPPQPQPQPNWQGGGQAGGTPWGSGDGFGGYSDPNPSWIAQGPEVFDEDGGSGKKRVIGVVLAIVLLAGIAFGAYMIWGRGGSSPSAGGDQTTAQSTTSTSTTPSAPPDPMPIGKFSGKVTQNKNVTAFTAVPNLKYLLDSETQAYTTAGAGKAKLAQLTLDGGVQGVILIVEATDATAANAAATALHEIQLGNGMTPFAEAPTTVLVGQIDAAGGGNARVRGHYGSEGMIVRVDVAAPALAAAQKGFKEVLDAQLKVLKADG